MEQIGEVITMIKNNLKFYINILNKYKKLYKNMYEQKILTKVGSLGAVIIMYHLEIS